MKHRIITVCALLLLCSTVAEAQMVANAESFESTTFLPSGWSVVGGSSNRWTRQSSSTFPSVTLGAFGIGFAKYASRGAPATTQTIALPVADYRQRGSHTPILRFYMYRDSLNKTGDSLSVYINTSSSLSGATHLGTIARYSRLNMPDTQIVNGWYPYTFSIPAAFNGASNYIMLKAIGLNGYNMYFDSFWWSTYPIVCSGKPTGATISSNPGQICGGSGTSALSLSGAVATYTGISITWQYAPAATGPWTTFGGNSTTASTGTINISKFYRCILNCSNSSENDTTPVYLMKVISTAKPSIKINPATANYCSNGAPVMLSASGANTYVWSPSTALSSVTDDTVYAAPANNTTYTIVGTDTQGCTGNTTVTVTVRQPPFVTIIAKDSILCAGDSVQLTANTGGGGNSYLWTPGNALTASVWAKPANTGIWSVTVKNTFGCTTTMGKTLHVKQKPVARIAFTQNGNTLHFRDSSDNAGSWHWDFGDGNESMKQNPVYTFSGNALYYVSLVVTNPPCANDTAWLEVSAPGLSASAKRLSQKPVILYPNPATDYIQFSTSVIGDILAVDAAGRQLKIQSNGNSANVSSLSPGMYLLRFQTQTGWQALHLVKR